MNEITYKNVHDLLKNWNDIHWNLFGKCAMFYRELKWATYKFVIIELV